MNEKTIKALVFEIALLTGAMRTKAINNEMVKSSTLDSFAHDLDVLVKKLEEQLGGEQSVIEAFWDNFVEENADVGIVDYEPN